jgi:hypothetical protein
LALTLKSTIGISLLITSFAIYAANEPEITVYDKALKLLEGFDEIGIDTFVNDEAKKCYVQEKSLLTKALLAVAKTKIRIEEDGTKADAVLMIGVETTSSSVGYCLSRVSLRLSGLAVTHFDKANLQKYAMVPLFEDYKLIHTKSLDHYQPVESATGELLNNFVYKWNYFNKSGKKNTGKSK